MRFSALLCALLVGSFGSAWAQVDLVDPDATAPVLQKRAPKAAAAPPSKENKEKESDADKPEGKAAGKAAAPTPSEPKPGEAKPSEARPAAQKAAAAPEAPSLVPVTEAELDGLWKAWLKASASAQDFKAEQGARAELVKAKRRIGATDAELWAMGLIRAAERMASTDIGAAVEIATTATELAPHLPGAWIGLSHVYFVTDPSGVGRTLSALNEGIRLTLSDPRYSRPLMADLGAIVLLTLIALAAAVMTVLALRRGSYFLYDFHFFFPRAAARWQTAALAIIVVALPVVFRLGWVPSLLAVFAALTMYLTMVERAVAVVLVSLLGFLPLLGQAVVERTTFAGTPAERLYLVDRGGPGSEALVQAFRGLAAENKAGFPELFTLGTYELRHGHLDDSVTALKQALVLKPNEPKAQTNLGVALLLQGDLENSRQLFDSAGQADPTLGSAHYNLGRVYQRRLATRGDSAAGEVDKANQAFAKAHEVDPSLDAFQEDASGQTQGQPPLERLKIVSLPESELLTLAVNEEAAARVRSQLAVMMTGDVSETAGTIYPFLISLLLLFVGTLSQTLGACRVCNKCGRPVSRHADPEVSAGSQMCTQCVNVFAKKNIAAPSLKVRKQLEVARYQSRIERTAYVLGVAVSGMGHVFAGWPVRGALFGFCFLFSVVAFVFRSGLLRVPYEPLPWAVRLVPATILFAVVYLVSLRGLRKKQG